MKGEKGRKGEREKGRKGERERPGAFVFPTVYNSHVPIV